ncbi:MAG: DUF3524 domain-containing protein [Gammaproteobacteria bacterium]|nr:DUF3524 domain-containing protein [Gammaproteobacteria bacterium]
MRILLLSAYNTPSHDYWSKVLLDELSDCQFTYLKLPARYFSWRIRGNSLTWGTGKFEELEQEYDLILATSLVDITALRGFRPHLAKVPLIVYFHENQFAYPVSENQIDQVQSQLLSIYNAACGDRIVFNSEFNRKTFIDGASRLLKKLPDGVPNGLSKSIQSKTQVLPVPLRYEHIPPLALEKQKPLNLLWNHRWEYDKQPELLFLVLKKLKNQIPFNIAIVGQQFRQSPAVFDQIKSELSEHITAWGYQEAEDYQRLLNQSNVVLSTALHDFQGLAIQDAMSYGCIPICPNRVAYPEYIHPELLYEVNNKPSSELQLEYEADNMAQKLLSLHQRGFGDDNAQLKKISKNQLIPKYRMIFEQLTG